MTSRVTSDFWVSAFRMRVDALNIPVYIRAKGDKTAGAIILKLDTLDGQAQAYSRSYDLDGNEEWVPLAHGSDAEVEQALARQLKYDPDLWIIEIEDRSAQSLFTLGLLPR